MKSNNTIKSLIFAGIKENNNAREIKFRGWDGKYFWLFGETISSLGEKFYRWPKKDDHYRYQYPLQQYTGLKDKNGVEIYEGDIVTDGYHEKYGRYEVKEGKVGWNFVSADSRELEIIGNIYENPELLKENK